MSRATSERRTHQRPRLTAGSCPPWMRARTRRGPTSRRTAASATVTHSEPGPGSDGGPGGVRLSEPSTDARHPCAAAVNDGSQSTSTGSASIMLRSVTRSSRATTAPGTTRFDPVSSPRGTSGHPARVLWLGWQPPREATSITGGPRSEPWTARPLVISQRPRERARPQPRWSAPGEQSPCSQPDVALSLLAGGASTRKRADRARGVDQMVDEDTQRAERAASAREGAHSHGRAADVSVSYFVTDCRASCGCRTSPVIRSS